MKKHLLLVFFLCTIWGKLFSQYITDNTDYNYIVELYLYAEYGHYGIPYATNDECQPVVTNIYDGVNNSLNSDFVDIGGYSELLYVKDYYSKYDYNESYKYIYGHLSSELYAVQNLNATYAIYKFQIEPSGDNNISNDITDFCDISGINCSSNFTYYFVSNYSGNSNIQTASTISKSDDGKSYMSTEGRLKIMPLYLFSLNKRFYEEGDGLSVSLKYKKSLSTKTISDNDITFSHPAYELNGMSFNSIDNKVYIVSSYDGFTSGKEVVVPDSFWGPGTKTIPYSSIVNAFGTESAVLGCELRIQIMQWVGFYATFETIPISFYYLPSLEFSSVKTSNAKCSDQKNGTLTATVQNVPAKSDSVEFVYDLYLYSETIGGSTIGSTGNVKNTDLVETLYENGTETKIYFQTALESGNMKSGTHTFDYKTLGAGIYKLKLYTLYNENSLMLPADTVFRISQPNPLNVYSLTPVNNWNGYHVRTGQTTGQLNVGITGGTPPYKYSFDPTANKSGFATYSANPLTASYIEGETTKTIYVSDAHNCSTVNRTSAFKRAGPVYIDINANSVSVTCNSLNGGTNDGEIEIKLSGGVEVYDIQVWPLSGEMENIFEDYSTTQNTFTIKDMGPENYRINVRDITWDYKNSNSDVYKNRDFEVTEPDLLEILDVETPPIACNGDDATAILTPSTINVQSYYARSKGGVVTGPRADSTLYLDANSDYYFYFTDINNCKSLEFSRTTASAPPAMNISANVIEQSSCAGSEDAVVEISPSGGTPYTGNAYLIRMEVPPPPNPDNSTHSTIEFDSLAAGYKYRFRVTDANACQDTVSYTPGIVPNPLHISSVNSTYAYCDERENGTISVSIDPGDRPGTGFTYRLLDNQYGQLAVSGNETLPDYTFSGRNAANYLVEVVDDAGCGDTIATSVIINPNQILVDNPRAGSSNTLCAGVGTGTISVEAQGGYSIESTYDYFLFDEAGTEINSYAGFVGPLTFSNLSEGQYTIVAADTASCFDTVSVEVGIEGQPVSIDQLLIGDQYCSELPGSIDVMARSGIAPIDTIVLTHTNGLPEGLSNSGMAYRSGLSGNNTTEYILTVIDTLGCQLDSAFIIQFFGNDPRISLGIIDSVACSSASNGIVKIDAAQPINAGDFLFTLNTKSVADASTVLFDSLSEGSYNLHVEDTMGCGTDTSFVLSAISEPVNISGFNLIDASCVKAANAGIGLQASGSLPGSEGYYFVLNSSDTLFGDTVTYLGYPVGGNYTVVLYDQYGCSDGLTGIQLLPRTDSLNITFDSLTNVSCPGYTNGKIQVQAINGNPFAKGFYYRILDQSDMSETDALYANGNPELTGIPKGVYSVEVNDSDNCSALLEDVEIVEPQAPELLVNPGYVAKKGDSTGWAGATISLGNGNYYVEWYNTAANGLILEDTTTSISSVSELAAGIYRVSIQDTAGCVFWDDEWLESTFTVPEPEDSLRLELQQMAPVSCNGLSDGTFTLEATGGWGNNYLFGTDPGNITSPDPLFGGYAAGTAYVFYARDTAGVVVSSSFDMLQPDVLSATIAGITDAACHDSTDGQLVLDISGGNGAYSSSADQLTWIPGNQLTGLAAGTYLVYVRDSLNCETTVTAMVNQPTAMFVADSVITNTECKFNEGSISATIEGGTPGYTYTWYNGDTLMADNDHEIDSLYSGVYTLHVSDGHGCLQKFGFYVIDSTSLDIANIETVPVSCWEGSNGSASIQIMDGFPPYTIAWPGGTTGNSVTGLASGHYQVVVLDAEGCRALEPFSIGTPDSLSVEIAEQYLPLCFGVANGVLDVRANGGTPGYDYEWAHGRSRTRAPNLDAGVYLLTVTDANNCTKDFYLGLDYAEQISSDLPQELTVCHGNTYPLEPGNFENFTWYHNGGYISTDPVLHVNKPGEYVVEFEDARGCQATDTVQVGVSDMELGAQFLMASIVGLGDTVVVFEASDPVPDSIELFIDESLEMLEGGQYFQYMVASDTGLFDITLVSYLGGCQDIITKKLTVLPEGEDEDIFKSTASKIIKSAITYPNPSRGYFSLELELARESDVTLRMVAFNDGSTLLMKKLRGSDYYLQPFKMEGLLPGTYLLSIQAGDEMQTLKIIVF